MQRLDGKRRASRQARFIDIPISARAMRGWLKRKHPDWSSDRIDEEIFFVICRAIAGPAEGGVH
jgi:hypothetical protein